MSREIKFRAWNTYEKRIESVGIIHFWEDGGVSINGARGCSDLKPMWFLMQFTGLKDKNGKEIYEGDIIDQKVEVSWDSSRSGFDPFIYEDDQGIIYRPEKCEVVGNVYENPELLK